MTDSSERAFWDWAVGAYENEDVAALCLELQDMHGQNVPLLLFSQWAAAVGVALDEDLLGVAASISRAYAGNVSEPLRAVRRCLKKPINYMADSRREGLRAQVKALELEAERAHMAELSTLIRLMGAGRPDVAQPNIFGVSKAWAGSIPQNPLIAFCDALSERGFLRYNT